MMRQVYVLFFLFLSLFSESIVFAESAPKNVFILQLTRHPALDETVRGIKDGLKNAGYVDGENLSLKVESGQGNMLIISQIAAKFANNHPDIVVGVGTIAAQSLMKYVKKDKIKMIFSSITDPISAGLFSEKNLYMSSGVSNFVPIKPQISLFRQLQPNLKRLGFLYNPSEANSLALIEKLKVVCAEFDMTLVLQAITKTSDIQQSTLKLLRSVEAVFISNDSTALSGLQTIINLANQSMIPVYVSDTDAVDMGALAAFGPDQYKIGLQTAAMISRVLSGEEISHIPFEFPNDQKLYINASAAKLLHIAIPEELVGNAVAFDNKE